MFPRSAAGCWRQCLVLGAFLAATAGAQINEDPIALTTITSPHSDETIALGTDYTVQWAAPTGFSGNLMIWLMGRPNLEDSTKIATIRELARYVELSSQAWVWRPENQISDSDLAYFSRFAIYMTMVESATGSVATSGEFQARKAIVPADNGTAPPAPNDTAPPAANDGGNREPLAAEVVTGIAIGVAAVLLLLAGVLFYYFTRRRRKGSQTQGSGVGGNDDDGGKSAGGHWKPELEGSGGYGSTAGAVAGALTLKPEMMGKEVPGELGGKENDRERPNPNERYDVAVHEIYEMDGSCPRRLTLLCGPSKPGLSRRATRN